MLNPKKKSPINKWKLHIYPLKSWSSNINWTVYICDGYTTVINLQTTCLFFSSCNFKIVGICRNGICIRSDEINGNLEKHEKMWNAKMS